MYCESMKSKTIIGKQYGYRSSANRAIKNFKTKFFVSIPSGFQFWVNQLNKGCFEIRGMKR